MYYLYGSKKNVPRRLVATFGSEQQLLAYLRWATLVRTGEQQAKFEQGSALASYQAWEQSAEPLTEENEAEVPFNPRLACCSGMFIDDHSTRQLRQVAATSIPR